MLDPQFAHGVAVDIHAQDVGRVRAHLGLVGGELHAADLAAAADQDLRLDDDRIADLAGCCDGVLDGLDDVPRGDLEAVSREQLLALILEKVHGGAGC